MNIDEVLNGVQILNPNYTKSKKNPQPKYITTSSPNILENNLASKLQNGELWSGRNLNYLTPYNFEDYGITPNRTIINPQKELAEAQNAWSKWGNAAAQTLVNEVGLGTLKAFSDIADAAIGSVFKSDNDYSNPVSAQLEKWQEDFRNNIAPIYTDPDVDIFNGGLTNAGWWASNVPSIASSLTLLIPSTTITKGLGLVGQLLAKSSKIRAFGNKTANAIEKSLNWTRGKGAIPFTIEGEQRARQLSNIGVNAALQRTMENYQEARGVYNDMYSQSSEKLNSMSDKDYAAFIRQNKQFLQDENVDINNRDEVAKAIARKSADTTFAMDYTNIIFDIAQMYTLRNVFGSGRASNVGRTAQRRAQRESIKYGLKDPAEIEKLKKAESHWTKFKTSAGDFLYGSKVAVGAQLSEGVEEAVNYIAQQEGMNTGNLLFGQGDKSSFDTRLSSYMQSPEIWESMFWGTLGGVVFQAAGSKLMRVKQTLEDKAEAKNKKDEDNIPTPSWKSLSQLPEVQRKVKDIEDRAIKVRQLADDIKQMRDKNEIPRSKDKDGNTLTFDNEQQKQAAIQKRKDDFITDITLKANNNGNFDLLKEYFASDEIRQAMIEQGVVSAEDAKAWQQEVLSKMERVRETYNKHIRNLNFISRDLETRSGQIPLEAIQLAATQNTKNELSIQSLEDAKQTMYDAYMQVKNEALNNGKIDEFLDYEKAIELQTQSRELIQLYDARDEILEALKENEDLGLRLSLDTINKKINRLQNLIIANRNEVGLGNLLYSLSNISAIYKSRNTEVDSKKAKDLDTRIIKAVDNGDFNDVLDFIGLERLNEPLSEIAFQAFQGRYKTLAKDTRNTITEIGKLGQETLDNYRQYIYLNEAVDDIKNAMINTSDDLSQFVGVVNNTLNESRQRAIKESSKKIEELFDKYGRETLERALSADYYGNEAAYNTAINQFETQVERDDLRTALKILDFSNPSNTSLYDKLEQMFDFREKINAAKAKTRSERTVNEDSESSTTNQNPSQMAETDSSITSSPQTSETSTGQENKQILNVEQQSIQPQPRFLAISENENGDVEFSIREHNDTGVQLVPTIEPGRYRVRTDKSNIWNNRKLYDLEDGASIIDNNAKVVQEPIIIIDSNGNVEVDIKGIVAPINAEDNTTPVEESTQVPERMDTPNAPVIPVADTTQQDNGSASTSSTGGEQSTQTNAPSRSNTQSRSKTDEDVAPSEDISNDVSVKVNADVIPTIKDFIGKKEPFTIDDIIDSLRSKYNTDDVDKDKLEIVLAKIKANPLYNKLVTKSNKAVNAIGDIVDTQNRNSTIIEQGTEGPTFNEAYSKAAETLFEIFNAQSDPIVVQDREGNKHYYFKFEDLLRFCNEQTGDPNIARAIYTMLKNYIETKSKDAKYPYRIVDDIIQADEQLVEVTLSEQEAIGRRLGESIEQRVSVKDLIDSIDNQEDKNKIYQELDKLQPDDELQVQFDGRGLRIEHNGIQIGYLPNPRITSDGAYLVINEGIYYNLKKDSNGEIQSPLKDILISWITQDSDSASQMNTLIYDIAFGKRKITENDIELFKNNPEFKKLVQNGLIQLDDAISQNDLNRKYTQVLNHFAKLWRYVNRNYVRNKDNVAGALENSIDNWFEKLYDSYDTINALSKNTNSYSIKVARVGQKGLNIPYNFKEHGYNSNEARENSPHINDALTPQSRRTFAIGFVPSTRNQYGFADTSVMKITNGQTITNIGSYHVGQTFGVVYDSRGNAFTTTIWGTNIRDNKLGETGKQIVSAIENELNKLVDDYCNAVPGSGKRLKEFIECIWSNGKNRNKNRGIFGGIVTNEFTNTENGIIVSIPGVQRSIKFSYGLYQGRPQFKYAINNGAERTPFVAANIPVAEGKTHAEIIKETLKEFLDNSSFDLNFDVLNYQINKNNSVGGFYHTDSNGLYIEIPNTREGQESIKIRIDNLNDFLIDNNLLKINLGKQKDYDGSETNFSRYDENNPITNEHLYIKINERESRIEELDRKEQEHQAMLQIIGNRSNERVNQLIDVLNDANWRIHKGKRIARILLGDNFTNSQINRLLNNINGVSIVPKTIIFDKNLETIAQYDIENNIVKVGTKWLQLAVNDRTKYQAVRKLIHEQIHGLLQNPDNVKYRNDVGEIRDLFRQYLNDNEDNIPSKKLAQLRQYLFEDIAQTNPNLALEEFLVESLTSKELIETLNEIDYTGNNKTETKESLFQRLIKIITEFFDWPIRQGSLYEYEFKKLGDLIQSNPDKVINSEPELTQQSESESTTPVEGNDVQTETPVQEQQSTLDENDVPQNDIFSNMDFDDVGNEYNSNIAEYGEIPSVQSLVNSIPVEQQAKVVEQINKGEINVKCK